MSEVRKSERGNFEPNREKKNDTKVSEDSTAAEEVERAWARAQRPGPNFWLAVNKPYDFGSTSLIFRKARTRLELKESMREIWASSGLFGLDTQRENWARSTSWELNRVPWVSLFSDLFFFRSRKKEKKKF